MRLVTLFSALVLATFAIGCIDDLPLAQLVLDTRPVGVRMEVDGEPGRAWPRPDESGTVTVFVIDPEDAAPIGWGFVICPAVITPTGLTFCGAEPLGLVVQMEPTLDRPVIPVSFPADRLEGFDNVLIAGVICPNGSPVFDLESDPPDVTCSGADEPRQLVSYTIHIARDAGMPPNNNPTIPDDAFTFAGEPWTESAMVPPETGCAAMAGTPELPLASRGDGPEPQELITIAGDPGDREDYPSSGMTRREDLIFAHYTTVGAPGRLFSVNDDATAVAELDWGYPDVETDPPIPDDGMLARWWFTVIDQRGGTGPLVRRFACVVP